MKLKYLLLAILAFAVLSCNCKNESVSIIKTDVPERPAGQQSVIGLTSEPMQTVRIGVVGLGMRGEFAVQRLTFVPGAQITAICDIEPDRTQRSRQWLVDNGHQEPACFSGEQESWKGLCERDDVDLVYICTDWLNHANIGLYAMEHGKHTAIEVPAALNLEEIWALINTSERTRKHCMMLENCVYDFFEMNALAMAQKGLFGEIVHAEGSYNHNLDPFWDEYWHSWRLEYNKTHRGDVYPTHGIGPVCQALNIHRGDRMTTLVAMDTDAFNGPRIVESRGEEPCPDFKNGDVTCSLIRTVKGKTILIEHDVLTPRPYSRMYQLVGTDGYAAKYPVNQFCLRENLSAEANSIGKEKVLVGDAAKELQAQYNAAILTPELEALAKKVGGHGGMDFIMDYRLVYCLLNGLPLDMDVYDLAEWCCVSELSRISIENGCVPVEVPDFTRGEWDKVKGFTYAL
ncbi:MAG: Gfo/Idh/MocA family oxidoreductase [Bacteroidales bacterium]|nr:Gfo/Idh/MocA family oxidoreductase [Bacteroidales bacterium]